MKIKSTLGVASLVMSVISQSQAAESVANRVLVKFKSVPGVARSFDATLDSLSDGARELGVISKERMLHRNLGIVRYSTASSALDAARALNLDANVEWAQPDYIVHTMVMPKAKMVAQAFSQIFADPSFTNPPVLPNPSVADPRINDTWGMGKIQAPAAWGLQKGNRDIVVADIDTGIDYNHEDLVNNLWNNPDAAAPDRHGYDFANKDAFPFDDQGHGTHTAGTIGATGGNGIGVSGVSQAVSVMAIKFITAQGSGTTSDAVLSIDYAIAHHARIMSNSWGGPTDQGEEDKALFEAVSRANDANILFVAAAGNDGTDNDRIPTYPAAIKLPNMLTVAATNNKDSRSFFSSFGKTTVHVGAPGSNVISTLPGNKYDQESGTSMACPHVAGLAALILAERPALTAVQVKQIIMESVDAIPGLQGKTVTGGRINAKAAIERARSFGI